MNLGGVMRLDLPLSRWMIGLALLASGAALFLFFRQPGPQQLARSIQKDVSSIRGQAFVSPVVVRLRGREDTAASVEAQLARAPHMAEYGKVVRKLGLYNGPLIQDPSAVMKRLVTARPEGGVGYYDEKLDTIFIEKDARGSIRLDGLAHEIYHAFQDQHFDLASYLVEKTIDGSLNADEIMARHAVVEGEATYVAMLWEARRAGAKASTPQFVSEAVKRRSEIDQQALVAMLSRPNASAQATATLAVLQQTPAFMFDGLFGAYQKGVAFVHALHEAGGWSEVEKLYSEYPPQSMTQILHPQKWLAREGPVRTKWPRFDTNPLFSDWKLLADNVLGEAQWRSVFREQGLSTQQAIVAAEGWNGDHYAVLERARDGALLLLWNTTWDTPADASEFADAYRRLLETKYAKAAQPVRVRESGRSVFIVEGGDEGSAEAYMSFVEQAQ